MTAIKVMEKGCEKNTSKYNLNLADGGYHIGSLICTKLACHKKVSFKALYIENNEGFLHELSQYSSDRIWEDCSRFYNYIRAFCAKCWHLNCMISGVQVSFYGPCHGTMVSVLLPDGAKILGEVEQILGRIEENLKK